MVCYNRLSAHGLELIAVIPLVVSISSQAAAHPPIALRYEPIASTSPHAGRDALDAKESARTIWLLQAPTSWALDQQKWDNSFSAKHRGHIWILRTAGLTLNIDDRDAHLISGLETP
jgi:hypothetical protein